jgi:hypothetical protein
MPNWCNNNLTLEHDDPAMIQRAFDALERGEFLSEFCPIPKELGDAIADGSVNAELVEKYGYNNWYDYCVNEWGTKWDCGEQGASDIHPDGRMLHTYFDSAWSPPIGAYEKLEKLGFRVDAQFYEGGMAFAGTYSDGNCDELNLEGMTADEIEQDYPELDESFGISESMREYEEPEEELTTWLKDGVEQKKALIAL